MPLPAAFALLLAWLPARAASPAEPSAPAYELRSSTGWLTMKDGNRVAVTYFMPEAKDSGERFPALLELLPYRKDDAFLARDVPLHQYFARRGFVSVKADVRGTGSSEGAVPEREYSDAEIADAEEIIAQLSSAPWSNGKVGMWGISWGGFNALITAMRRPPALRAALAAHASDDLFHDDVRYIDGILHLDEYALAIDHDNALPRSPDYPLDAAYFSERFERRPWLYAYLERQQDGEFWRKKSMRFDCAAVAVPVYLIGGLLDSYRDAVPRLLECLKVPAKGELGPWTHAWPDDGEPGPNYEWRRQAVRWFDLWLKDKDTGVRDDPRFLYYARDGHSPGTTLKRVPGRWRAADWPLPEASLRTLFPAGNGRLEATAPSGGEDRLVYRPEAGFEAGFFWGELTPDMSPADAAALVYDGAPLDEELELAGFPRLRLRGSSSAALAHWVARLEDVAPDGTVALVTGAALNGAQRGSRLEPSALTPGRFEDFELDLHFTSWRFARGHRVRLALSNGLFPMLWPLPQPVESALALGPGTALELPVAEPGPEEEPALPPPEPRETRADAADLDSRGWPYETSLSSDPATGETMANWLGENLYRIPQGRIEATQAMRYRVHPKRPGEASWQGEAKTLISLENRKLELRSEARLNSAPGAFTLRFTRGIWQDGRLVRKRSWNETIPRRFQ